MNKICVLTQIIILNIFISFQISAPKMEISGPFTSLIRPINIGQLILSTLLLFSINIAQGRHHDVENSGAPNLEKTLLTSLPKTNGKL